MTTPRTIFTRRQQIRIQSWKESTVRTREYEYQREGVFAATLKVKNKWRLRKHRAKQRLQQLSVYIILKELSPHLCDVYLNELSTQFDRLRDSELQKVVQCWEAVKSSTPSA
jgi:hypothetical protein